MTMTGLRDRKKQAVRQRIIEVAEGLFAADGLDATTIEGIAERAEVSAGTVYNYFGSKGALLLAAVERDTDAMIHRGRAVLARPGTNPAKAVRRLVGIYLDEFTSWEKGFLREVMAASFQRVGGAELTAGLVRMDERLIDQLTALLGGFHDRGRMRADVDPSEATMLILSALMAQLLMSIAFDELDGSVLKNQVDRQIDLAFDGLRGAE